jgi:3-oxoacyl-[acyl-carrier-protein] synthase-3
VLATATPDQTFPATATIVQDAIGAQRRHGVRRGGGVLGLSLCDGTADSMLRTGMARRALVIGAETFSRILDWEDRATCVLFGDGAGAIVLEARKSTRPIRRRPAFWPAASMPMARTTSCSMSMAGLRRRARSASCA